MESRDGAPPKQHAAREFYASSAGHLVLIRSGQKQREAFASTDEEGEALTARDEMDVVPSAYGSMTLSRSSEITVRSGVTR